MRACVLKVASASANLPRLAGASSACSVTSGVSRANGEPAASGVSSRLIFPPSVMVIRPF